MGVYYPIFGKNPLLDAADYLLVLGPKLSCQGDELKSLPAACGSSCFLFVGFVVELCRVEDCMDKAAALQVNIKFVWDENYETQESNLCLFV